MARLLCFAVKGILLSCLQLCLVRYFKAGGDPANALSPLIHGWAQGLQDTRWVNNNCSRPQQHQQQTTTAPAATTIAATTTAADNSSDLMMPMLPLDCVAVRSSDLANLVCT